MTTAEADPDTEGDLFSIGYDAAAKDDDPRLERPGPEPRLRRRRGRGR